MQQEVATDALPPPAEDKVTTLEEVRALKPEDEPLDLYRFRNPVTPAPNRFSKSWSEPPTPEQVQAFVTDGRPDAYERLIDRLLASPRKIPSMTGFGLEITGFVDKN